MRCRRLASENAGDRAERPAIGAVGTGIPGGTKKAFRVGKSSMNFEGGIYMTEELIKEIKHIQKCLVAKEMVGDEWEEKMEMVKKLEDVASYLKDALGRGIEF